MLDYDAVAVACPDRLYSTPPIVDQRRRLRAVVAAAGEAGLDIGSGAGHLACELAREVARAGTSWRSTGVASPSRPPRSGSRRKDLERVVDVRIGDATALELPDETYCMKVASTVVRPTWNDSPPAHPAPDWRRPA